MNAQKSLSLSCCVAETFKVKGRLNTTPPEQNECIAMRRPVIISHGGCLKHYKGSIISATSTQGMCCQLFVLIRPTDEEVKGKIVHNTLGNDR